MATVSCNSAKEVTTKSLLEGTWVLVLFPSGEKSFAEIFGQRTPELQFDLNNKVTGTSGCNHISGSFTKSETMLQFDGNMIMTKMACPGYDESIFMEALQRVNRYKFRDDQLDLMQEDTPIMTLAKKKT